ncbi:hypothetical protein X943_000119 [Babesia divergens]|uniref:Uncharacterized protein n=1 Tax=Babesia divergens TaxID=32595 RepID=A0AAD9GCH6_BABDI|nr:hypothetical protein X943_000119 [Babesia divergens]
MDSSASVLLMILGIIIRINIASADQYTFTLPVYVYPIKHFPSYGSASTNRIFLNYFQANVVNMMVNTSAVKNESFQEVFDASIFSTTSSSSELNLNAATLINRMWARDFINEINMYRMSYIHQRYLCASQQLMKEPLVNDAFEDMTFDEPLDRMVVYQWIYHLQQSYTTFMTNASKLHLKWQSVREKLNTDTPPES